MNNKKYRLLEKDETQAALESAPYENISVAEKAINVTEIPINAASMQQSKVKKSKVNESKVCMIEFPCKDGVFKVDEDLFDTYTHTYPKMDIEKSLKQLKNYLCTNPGKQRYLKSIREQIDWWLCGDDAGGKYRKSEERYGAGYDISLYESTSVIDEEE